MLGHLKRQAAVRFAYPFLKHRHGPEWIDRIGPRDYVGGRWDEIGPLQFNFLKSQGLKPHHTLLDLGCGCLRVGRFLIPYLYRGHYMGIDKEAKLILAGQRELSHEVWLEKCPAFTINSSFDFKRLPHQADFIWAHSLFTHLPLPDIDRCLRNLSLVAAGNATLYASFFEGPYSKSNPKRGHDHMAFYYTFSELESLSEKWGWRASYLGDWGHPRDQKMMVYHRDR